MLLACTLPCPSDSHPPSQPAGGYAMPLQSHTYGVSATPNGRAQTAGLALFDSVASGGGLVCVSDHSVAQVVLHNPPAAHASPASPPPVAGIGPASPATAASEPYAVAQVQVGQQPEAPLALVPGS
jgi:hypothetical protein